MEISTYVVNRDMIDKEDPRVESFSWCDEPTGSVLVSLVRSEEGEGSRCQWYRESRPRNNGDLRRRRKS